MKQRRVVWLLPQKALNQAMVTKGLISRRSPSPLGVKTTFSTNLDKVEEVWTRCWDSTLTHDQFSSRNAPSLTTPNRYVVMVSQVSSVFSSSYLSISPTWSTLVFMKVWTRMEMCTSSGCRSFCGSWFLWRWRAGWSVWHAWRVAVGRYLLQWLSFITSSWMVWLACLRLHGELFGVMFLVMRLQFRGGKTWSRTCKSPVPQAYSCGCVQ